MKSGQSWSGLCPSVPPASWHTFVPIAKFWWDVDLPFVPFFHQLHRLKKCNQNGQTLQKLIEIAIEGKYHVWHWQSLTHCTAVHSVMWIRKNSEKPQRAYAILKATLAIAWSSQNREYRSKEQKMSPLPSPGSPVAGTNDVGQSCNPVGP